MTRVVLLASNFPPMTGGISSFMYEFVRHFPPDDVVVIGLPTPGYKTFDAKQQFAIKRLNVPSIWNTTSFQYKFLAPYYYNELLRLDGVDYVLCDAAHHTMMVPLWFLKATRGIPFGVFAHGVDLLRQQKRFFTPIFNRLVQSADAVFVNSHRTSNIALDIVGTKPEKIHEVNPPVNLNLTRNISPNAIRNALCLENKKCMLTVGNLVERKGHDMVIRALPKIIDKVPNVHYVIIGRGLYEDNLRRLAKDLNVETYITFVGFVPVEELGSYYALCDVFVMVSREIPEKGDIEGFGIVYLEANLFGKPVVAGRSGGVPDAVLDGQTGLMVDPNNASDVADTIIRILSDTSLARRLGEIGQARTIREFSGRTLVQDILKVIE